MDDAVMDEAEKPTAICDNGLCAKTAKADGGNLLVCGGCGWARYCSVVCQKLCRKRHKMVCINHHILSMEDDLWTVDGDLKGQPTFRSELAQGRFGTTV
ncbi:hypothetical protein HYALB_00006465 [Hymenoscyphus albidus]|uniref:MYND-type domain-containing protein n=1 Tax=Hymenoscyphus albidus TaxID=595503 RepID=A0A9N9Q356_9HELO|nr:hypothetical protein HYALB_00006465 [Hymenoscyphus albidus]